MWLCCTLFAALIFDICPRLLNHHSPFSKDDLEGGGILATPEDTGPLHKVYSYLFERGAPASWKLLGCCTLVVSKAILPPLNRNGLTIVQGLTNAFSTLLTLAEVTNLGFCMCSATADSPLVMYADFDLSRYYYLLKRAPSLHGFPHLLNLAFLFLALPMGERTKRSRERTLHMH